VAALERAAEANAFGGLGQGTRPAFELFHLGGIAGFERIRLGVAAQALRSGANELNTCGGHAGDQGFEVGVDPGSRSGKRLEVFIAPATPATAA
jgi:hypothetical protein